MKKAISFLAALMIMAVLFPAQAFADDHGLLFGKTMKVGSSISNPLEQTNIVTDGNLGNFIGISYYNANEPGLKTTVFYEFESPQTIVAYRISTNTSNQPDLAFYDKDKNELARIEGLIGSFAKIDIPPVSNVTYVAFENRKTWGFRIYELDVYGEEDLTPPEAPTGLHVVSVGDGTATIEWLPNNDGDTAGYRVYLNGNLQNTTLLKSTSYEFGGLTNGQTYTVQVSAVDDAGNESQLSAAVSFTPEMIIDAPPAAPTGLIAKTGVNQVILYWNANKESDISGYYVYRDGSRISSIISGTTYTDSGLNPGTEYSYFVIAVDDAGNESDPSDAVAVTTQTQYSIVPPSTIQAKPDKSKMQITVSWSTVPDASSYKLYKNGENITDTMYTSYIDTDVREGELYKYQVSTVIDGVNSGMSNVAQAKILADFEFDGSQLDLSPLDMIKTGFSFAGMFDEFTLLILGIIFAPVAIGFIVWLIRNKRELSQEEIDYRRYKRNDKYYDYLTRKGRLKERDEWARRINYSPENREDYQHLRRGRGRKGRFYA